MQASDLLPVLLLWGVSSGQLAAQPAPPANADSQELSTRDSPVTFTSRTNLVLVPVVVRDRQGKAVGNLRQEDFQLLDKGKPQIITKFTIENARSPVADLRGFVLFERMQEHPQPTARFRVLRFRLGRCIGLLHVVSSLRPKIGEREPR